MTPEMVLTGNSKRMRTMKYTQTARKAKSWGACALWLRNYSTLEDQHYFFKFLYQLTGSICQKTFEWFIRYFIYFIIFKIIIMLSWYLWFVIVFGIIWIYFILDPPRSLQIFLLNNQVFRLIWCHLKSQYPEIQESLLLVRVKDFRK